MKKPGDEIPPFSIKEVVPIIDSLLEQDDLVKILFHIFIKYKTFDMFNSSSQTFRLSFRTKMDTSHGQSSSRDRNSTKDESQCKETIIKYRPS